ncbi:MAG: hypothetical protein F4158_08465 [Synechococcus sp. SB0675_bin_7]|nr:hypothetical protein [Synechococcus sp. SB0675_bin_7]
MSTHPGLLLPQLGPVAAAQGLDEADDLGAEVKPALQQGGEHRLGHEGLAGNKHMGAGFSLGSRMVAHPWKKCRKVKPKGLGCFRIHAHGCCLSGGGLTPILDVARGFRC